MKYGNIISNRFDSRILPQPVHKVEAFIWYPAFIKVPIMDSHEGRVPDYRYIENRE